MYVYNNIINNLCTVAIAMVAKTKYRIVGNFQREKFLEISEKKTVNSENIFPNILCSYI